MQLPDHRHALRVVLDDESEPIALVAIACRSRRIGSVAPRDGVLPDHARVDDAGCIAASH